MSTTAQPPDGPYASSAANGIYNLLFCDDLAAFRPQPGESATDWQRTLFAEPADKTALQSLASDPAREGRVRYLAFAKLRAIGRSVPAKILLGVIVEVPSSGGLDVLAAYADGSVRYLNRTGELVVLEGVPQIEPHVRRLFEASSPVVSRIGPWLQPRRPPPKADSVRLTFLVSDGMYFGEGPVAVMQREPLAGPVIQRAVELLRIVVSLAH